ncbi:MAG: hypothetical protein ACXAEU_15755, partial [Candidatus Hodarchaeales archaeon]
MKHNSPTEKYLDIIINEPELAISTLNPDQIKILRNPRYLNLLKIMHKKGPLTINDLTEEYSKLVEVNKVRSKTTIYRYITQLKRSSIIQEAGKRVVEGKAHNKTLYWLTANNFIVDEKGNEWKGSREQIIFKELMKILKILYPRKMINEKALYQWHKRLQQSIIADKKLLINSGNPEILEILSIWTPYSFDDIIAFLGWESFLLKEPSAQEDFLKCFSDSKMSTTEQSSSIESDKYEKVKENFRDVITQFPEFWHGLSTNDPRHRYLEKSSYVPLFHVLQDGPMTIKEITKSYNEVASIPKTQKTIYRYIKTLKDTNLIIEMGYRVIQGKKTTQKLYGPISRNIVYIGEFDPDWETNQRQWLLDSIILLLNFLHPDLPKIDRKCFHEYRAF